MEEMKDKLSGDSKSRLEAEIKKVEEAVASNNTDQIKSATDSLNKVWNEIASQLYSQAGAQGKGTAGSEQQQSQQSGKTEDKKENVQDASYEVVDEDEEKNKNKK